jgi:uncharacterized protein (DUF4415 family)
MNVVDPFKKTRRTMNTREAAEAAFKSATEKTAPPLPVSAPAIPGARELVSIRVDRAVLDHFQADGPGWQDRMNDALKAAAGL